MTATKSVDGVLLITTEIAYPIMVAMLMGFHCFKVSFAVSAVRYKHMDKKYIEDNLREENEMHLEEFGEGIAKGGHPDNVSIFF